MDFTVAAAMTKDYRAELSIRPFHLYALAALSLSLTFDYHLVWLVYDFCCMLAAVISFRYGYVQRTPISFAILLSYLAYAALSIAYVGVHLISFLSVWDTLKNITFLWLSFGLLATSPPRAEIVGRKLGKLIICIFFMQAPLVFSQYLRAASAVDVDDVAGTFGKGSSHALAYLGLSASAAALFVFRSRVLMLTVVVLSFGFDWMAENLGGYIMLALLLACWMVTNSKDSLAKYAMILPPVLMVLLAISTIPQVSSSGLVTVGRALDVLNASTAYFAPTSSDLAFPNRGEMMNYAAFIGGGFGGGFGGFSDIYQMHGWRVAELLNADLNISEYSHLVAEEGFIGCALALGTFLALAQGRGLQKRVRWLYVTLFVVCFFYNRFLMDERMIFFFTSAVLFVGSAPGMNNRRGRALPIIVPSFQGERRP